MREAIYAGSFDPITNGHLDILLRAREIFDRIHVGILHHPDKEGFFSIDERLKLVQSVLAAYPGFLVETFEGLLVDYARGKKVYTVIRGLRAVSDFDYECQMALMNRKLEPKIDTLFLRADEKYSYLSSSLIRQIAAGKGDIQSFVPKEVAEELSHAYSK